MVTLLFIVSAKIKENDRNWKRKKGARLLFQASRSNPLPALHLFIFISLLDSLSLSLTVHSTAVEAEKEDSFVSTE